jgi:hypothetical protein
MLYFIYHAPHRQKIVARIVDACGRAVVDCDAKRYRRCRGRHVDRAYCH